MEKNHLHFDNFGSMWEKYPTLNFKSNYFLLPYLKIRPFKDVAHLPDQSAQDQFTVRPVQCEENRTCSFHWPSHFKCLCDSIGFRN